MATLTLASGLTCTCCAGHTGRCAFKKTDTPCKTRQDCDDAYPNTPCYCMADDVDDATLAALDAKHLK